MKKIDEVIERFLDSFKNSTTRNFDISWDGKIIDFAKKLDENGLHVTLIYRKGKVRCSYSDSYNRAQVLALIVGAIGENDFLEITFAKKAHQVFIQFDMGKSIKRFELYR
jgi:hypothetical protein